MLYKGRKVEYVRDAAKNDPYYDPEYKQVIVMYVDGEGYETVKEEQLDGWDAKERKGFVSDEEKKQAVAQDNAKKAAEHNLAHNEENNLVKSAPLVQTVPFKPETVNKTVNKTETVRPAVKPFPVKK